MFLNYFFICQARLFTWTIDNEMKLLSFPYAHKAPFEPSGIEICYLRNKCFLYTRFSQTLSSAAWYKIYWKATMNRQKNLQTVGAAYQNQPDTRLVGNILPLQKFQIESPCAPTFEVKTRPGEDEEAKSEENSWMAVSGWIFVKGFRVKLIQGFRLRWFDMKLSFLGHSVWKCGRLFFPLCSFSCDTFQCWSEFIWRLYIEDVLIFRKLLPWV